MTPSPERECQVCKRTMRPTVVGECPHCGSMQLGADELPAPDRRWPVAELALSGAGHLYIPAPSMRAERQKYYPADHPAILSPDEARLLTRFFAKGSDDFSTAEKRALDRLAADMADYADEGGHS